MLNNSTLELFISGVALGILILILIKGLGVIKLRYLNFKWLYKFQQSIQDTDNLKKKEALTIIIDHCNSLNSRWLLGEPDLKFLNNTFLLIKKIAHTYHPNSKTPMEETRIRCILNSFLKLQNYLIELSTFKEIHAFTQFRVRHILTLSRAWETKESWKQWKFFVFLKNHRLYPLFSWLFFIIRCLDLTFWAIKMATYILQDIVLKIFLVRWYLVMGELAIQVYSDKVENPEIQIESILDNLDAIPEPENQSKNSLPNKIKKISEASRNEILYHTWSVEWIKVKEIYINLINSIAREHYPNSEKPLYEVKLSGLLSSGLHFSEQIATIQTYPFVNRILDLRISHALMTRDASDFLTNNQVLSWVRKHKLGYIFKYSLLLFKIIQKKHPALLFRDFAFTLAGEGCKRWLYLYLHDKIAVETNTLYQIPKNAPPKTD